MLKSNCNCKWGGCACSKAGKILLFIGGLNWGLVGLGMLMGTDLNVIHMILGAWPIIEGIVYVLVGVAAVMKIFCCRCKKCMDACASCSCSMGSSEGKMESSM